MVAAEISAANTTNGSSCDHIGVSRNGSMVRRVYVDTSALSDGLGSSSKTVSSSITSVPAASSLRTADSQTRADLGVDARVAERR